MSNVGLHFLTTVLMTKAHLVHSKFRVIIGVLSSLGLCLNFVLAVSPLWGWSSFLGWASALVLVVFALDERKNIRLALTNQHAPLDRILATCLLALPTLAIGVNLALLAFGRELLR